MKQNCINVEDIIVDTYFVELSQIHWKKIAMLEPFYTPIGKSACRVHYIDGSYDNLPHRCETVLSHLARQHYTTVERARAMSDKCDISDQKRRKCMLFSETCCVIPLKCQDTPNRSHSTLGYVVLQYLKQFVALSNGNTLLLFHEKHKGVEIMQKLATVEKQVRNAKQLILFYNSQKQELGCQFQPDTPPVSKHIGRNW